MRSACGCGLSLIQMTFSRSMVQDYRHIITPICHYYSPFTARCRRRAIAPGHPGKACTPSRTPLRGTNHHLRFTIHRSSCLNLPPDHEFPAMGDARLWSNTLANTRADTLAKPGVMVKDRYAVIGNPFLLARSYGQRPVCRDRQPF